VSDDVKERASDSKQKTSARWVATRVLERVVVEGAYATRALDAELSRAGLEERDARLATEIVYGALRTLPALEARLAEHLRRGRPDSFTMAALVGATYQALHLPRVPPFAIVGETVAIVKQKRGERLGGLANAVLRKIVSARPEEPAPPRRLVVPEWVEKELARGIGADRVEATLALDGHAPPLGLRVQPGIDPSALAERIRAAVPRASLRPSDVVPACLCGTGLGDPRALPGFAEGEFAVQDEGAQLVAALVGARPGERILDACAGHGGKTMMLASQVGPSGHVVAVDLHEAKLQQLKSEAARLGIESARVSTETIDLSVGDGGLEGGFDRVLVDAPCTGLGTLRRRPELLLRLEPRDCQRLAALQYRLLSRVLPLVRPGGVLVYAVCSSSAAEATGVAEKLEASFGGILRRRDSVETVTLSAENDGVFRIGPWLSTQGGAPDVYQVVRWEVLDSHSAPV
jgi:16S rRNA (cytosine967-C5)-methyltransferase